MIIVLSDDSIIKVVDDNKNLNIFAKDINKKTKRGEGTTIHYSL